MARRSLGTLVGMVERLVRTYDLDEDVIPYFLNNTLNDLAVSNPAIACFQAISDAGTLNPGSSSFTLDMSAETSLNVGANPIALLLLATGGDLIAYSPEFIPWSEYREDIKYRLDVNPATGRPEVWTAGVADPEGRVTISVYPRADIVYLAYVLMSFVPHEVNDTAQYLLLPEAAEFVAVLGTAYMTSRGEQEEMSLFWRREYVEAEHDLLLAYSGSLGLKAGLGQGNITQERSRRLEKPYIKETGSAPVIAWDHNPAIPYDPANPDGGFPTP